MDYLGINVILICFCFKNVDFCNVPTPRFNKYFIDAKDKDIRKNLRSIYAKVVEIEGEGLLFYV
jgi:hypothetical protein